MSGQHPRPVVFKQEGLDQRLQYDDHPRKSLIDHFYDHDVIARIGRRGEAPNRAISSHGPYEARMRRNPDRMQVMLSREGHGRGVPLKITKGMTLEAGSSTLEIAYMLEGCRRTPVHFGVEFNFAGLPAGADDRYFFDEQATTSAISARGWN